MALAIHAAPESKPFQANWVPDLRSRRQARIAKAGSLSLWDVVSTVLFPLMILRGLWWGVREGMDRLAGKLTKKYLLPPSAIADRDFDQFWAQPRSTLDKIATMNILPSSLIRPSAKLKQSFEQFWFKEPLTEDNAVLRTAFIAERKMIRTPDGVTLQAVVYRSRNSDPNTTPTVICCNPNLGLQEENGFKDLMSQSILDGIACNFVTFDYRSAGGAEGTFTCEDDLYNDASSVVDFVKKEMKTPPNLIDLYGYSLGGAVALKTQALHPELQGPQVSDRSFSSLEDWISSKTPRPIGWLASRVLKEKELVFDAASDFKKIQARKLLLFHDQDPILGSYASLRNRVELGADDQAIQITPKPEWQQIKMNHHNDPLKRYNDKSDQPVLTRISQFLFSDQLPNAEPCPSDRFFEALREQCRASGLDATKALLSFLSSANMRNIGELADKWHASADEEKQRLCLGLRKELVEKGEDLIAASIGALEAMHHPSALIREDALLLFEALFAQGEGAPSALMFIEEAAENEAYQKDAFRLATLLAQRNHSSVPLMIEVAEREMRSNVPQRVAFAKDLFATLISNGWGEEAAQKAIAHCMRAKDFSIRTHARKLSENI